MAPDEDDIATQMITKLNWLTPVDHADQLPTEGVPEGAMCFVQSEGEEEVWQWADGAWARIDIL